MGRLEGKWSAALRETPPPRIEATAKPIYSGDSERPTTIVVEWTKDGKMQKPVFIDND